MFLNFFSIIISFTNSIPFSIYPSFSLICFFSFVPIHPFDSCFQFILHSINSVSFNVLFRLVRSVPSIYLFLICSSLIYLLFTPSIYLYSIRFFCIFLSFLSFILFIWLFFVYLFISFIYPLFSFHLFQSSFVFLFRCHT